MNSKSIAAAIVTTLLSILMLEAFVQSHDDNDPKNQAALQRFADR